MQGGNISLSAYNQTLIRHDPSEQHRHTEGDEDGPAGKAGGAAEAGADGGAEEHADEDGQRREDGNGNGCRPDFWPAGAVDAVGETDGQGVDARGDAAEDDGPEAIETEPRLLPFQRFKDHRAADEQEQQETDPA